MTWVSDREADVIFRHYVHGRYLYVTGENMKLCEVIVYGGRDRFWIIKYGKYG
jgi:hypothetical protein